LGQCQNQTKWPDFLGHYVDTSWSDHWNRFTLPRCWCVVVSCSYRDRRYGWSGHLSRHHLCRHRLRTQVRWRHIYAKRLVSSPESDWIFFYLQPTCDSAYTPSTPNPLNFGCRNQKWSRIRIWISWLSRIRVSAVSHTKCRPSGFIPMSASAGDCMKYANKSPNVPYSAILHGGKLKSDPEFASWTG